MEKWKKLLLYCVVVFGLKEVSHCKCIVPNCLIYVQCANKSKCK